jgi:hypothetical protein
MPELVHRNAATGFHAGRKYVTIAGIEGELGPGRKSASLSEARQIIESGWYWISAESEKVGEGTWRGVPTEKGHYRDNKDGTFTRVPDGMSVDWRVLLYVDVQAAARAVRGEGHLVLGVWGYSLSRMYVISSEDRPRESARVASVPQTQADSASEASKIPGQPFIGARRSSCTF